jgi:uncharacterized linocin/CFP29 family protein
MMNGTNGISWGQDVWDGINQAVATEIKRSAVVAKLLPVVGPFPDALTIPSDRISPGQLAIAEDAVQPLVELSAEFTLTPTQAQAQTTLLSATTLATRAANLLAQAEDALLFQGDSAKDHEVFKFIARRGSIGIGLVNSAPHHVEVKPVNAAEGRYGENTFAAVAKAYTLLQASGQYGPYALVLNDKVYADTFAPLPGTLTAPSDRIAALATAGFVGAGTLPARTGLLISVGGNTIDFVVWIDPVATFAQVDVEGVLHFRVAERFTLRVKDPAAILRLQFAAK